jgi:hypothetical protein
MIVPRKNAGPPALALHAKVAKFGCTHSLQGGWGRSFCKFFLRETEAEILEIWDGQMVGVERNADKQVNHLKDGNSDKAVISY